MPMTVHYPQGINNVSTSEWLRMPHAMLIDSGAADTILPSDWFTDHELQESYGSRNGAYYLAASGTPIRNEGERSLAMVTAEGQMRKMLFQVAKTTKALGSVSKIVANGNSVTFDSSGSYIYNKTTGEYTALREENGVYLLDVCVAPAAWKPEQGIPASAIQGLIDGTQQRSEPVAPPQDSAGTQGEQSNSAFAGPRK